MKKYITNFAITMACFVTLLAPTSAFAFCDGCVTGAVNLLDASVQAMNATISQLLYNIGIAINENGNKVSHTIEAASRSEREFGVVQEKNRRYEDARQRYVVPANICSESASGGATQVNVQTGTMAGGIRPGGNGVIADASIAQAINAPAPAPEVDTMRSAKIHAKFCDADDHASYGGSRACPAVSATMPGADKRMDSLVNGAGPNDKPPELTFSQEQIDAARMYTQNSVRRSIGPQLRKGEADTVVGAQYIGIMNQYSAIVSAAAYPQDARIAESLPNPATKDLIAEAQQSPSAMSYYNNTASTQAKATGMMSAREFETYEVGRRYANTEYQADLQAMSGDNLLREQIRVSSLNNWLLQRLKNEIQQGNIINGQILGSVARQEFEPTLTQKYRVVGGRMGGQ